MNEDQAGVATLTTATPSKSAPVAQGKDDKTNPLKELLDETGMSQREFGKLIGLEAGTISKKVNGRLGFTRSEIVLYRVLLKLGREGRNLREFLSDLS